MVLLDMYKGIAMWVMYYLVASHVCSNIYEEGVVYLGVGKE